MATPPQNVSAIVASRIVPRVRSPTKMCPMPGRSQVSRPASGTRTAGDIVLGFTIRLIRLQTRTGLRGCRTDCRGCPVPAQVRRHGLQTRSIAAQPPWNGILGTPRYPPPEPQPVPRTGDRTSCSGIRRSALPLVPRLPPPARSSGDRWAASMASEYRKADTYSQVSPSNPNTPFVDIRTPDWILASSRTARASPGSRPL